MRIGAKASASAAALMLLLASSVSEAQPMGCAEIGPAGAFINDLVAAAPTVDPMAAQGFCGAIGDLQRRLEAAESEARALRADPAPTDDVLPTGTIVLVDDGRGCPPGWSDVALVEPQVFAGRVPVAVGFAEGRVFRSYRQVGGGETTVLEERNLPPHAHELPFAFTRMPEAARQGQRPGSGLSSGLTGGGRLGDQMPVSTFTGRESSERTGAAAPVQTMPPFVALFWCRKDG